jgi:putative ABC transport system permease protein
MNDVRFGLRQLLKNPGFTAVAVITLALGIGATTALFSVIHAVLINPYPYARPHEIWTPGHRTADANQQMRPYKVTEFQEMAKLSVFSDVMGTSPGNSLLTGEFAPETVRTVRVSANAFQFLGVKPVLGRGIQPTDVSPSGVAEPVAVLTYKRWQRLFSGDPSVPGRTLLLNDQRYTIVGVMPSRFGWWTDDGVWLPLDTSSREPQSVFPIARLKPGVSATAATERFHQLQVEFARTNPNDFPRDSFTSILTNYLDITAASGEMQRSLQLLFGAVGFLLLIACANVANLQLAKATSRAREVAIRLSIGAGRAQLVRQLLTESVILSVAGGLLGLLVAYLITGLMVALMPSFFVPNEARIEVNRYVLAFSVIVSVLTGVLFGLVPAIQTSRPTLLNALKDETRGSTALASGRIRTALIVAEVALSVVLLVSAGLTIRSFLALQRVDLGFQPEQVVNVGLPLNPRRYATLDERNRFANEIVERIANLPGVASVTIGNGGLPFGGPQSNFTIEGQPESKDRLMIHAVSADYLRTLGIQLRQGRMFREEEIRKTEPVALINEATAKLWPKGEDPLGRRVRLNFLENPGRNILTPTNLSPFVTIIGVFANTRNDDVRNDSRPSIILPFSMIAPPQRNMAIRTTVEPASLMNAIRKQVAEMDKEQPVNGPTAFQEILRNQTAQPRFVVALFSLFAGLGLALATAGIYSVLSYLVSMRTREIGVRMALGARRSNVLTMIFSAGGKMVALGMVLGLLGSLAAVRLLGSQLELYQVNLTDPLSFAGVILLLGFVATAAFILPAMRAASVNPTEALRYE